MKSTISIRPRQTELDIANLKAVRKLLRQYLREYNSLFQYFRKRATATLAEIREQDRYFQKRLFEYARIPSAVEFGKVTSGVPFTFWFEKFEEFFRTPGIYPSAQSALSQT